MKKLSIKCLAFVYRHRYKLIGGTNACCATEAIIEGNIHAFVAWLVAYWLAAGTLTASVTY